MDRVLPLRVALRRAVLTRQLPRQVPQRRTTLRRTAPKPVLLGGMALGQVAPGRAPLGQAALRRILLPQEGSRRLLVGSWCPFCGVRGRRLGGCWLRFLIGLLWLADYISRSPWSCGGGVGPGTSITLRTNRSANTPSTP